MDSITTVDTINVYSDESQQQSRSIICYDFKNHIPHNYQESKMSYAYLMAIQDNSYEFQMELLRVLDMDRIVLRIRTDDKFNSNLVQYKYQQMFNTVLFERIPVNYDADEESGNDDDRGSTGTNSPARATRKKDTKTLKKERQIRKQYKQHNNEHNPSISALYPQIKPPHLAHHASPPAIPIQSEPVHTISDIKPNILVLPPSPSSPSSTKSPSSSSSTKSPSVVLPPKPQFNFADHQNQDRNQDSQQNQEEEEKQIEMSRPVLPRFDFSDYDAMESDLDKVVLSDTHSSKEPYRRSAYNSPYFDPPPPLSTYKKKKTKYKARPTYTPSPMNNQRNKPSISSSNKVERRDAPQLRDIFGCTQSHDEFRQYHESARKTYSDKLKTAPKMETNAKNYFLLPILTKFNHTIGTKIGELDYGFHSDANNNGSLKGRDSNKHYGVDYEIKQKDDAPQGNEKNEVSIVLEVMQAMQYVRDKDYYFDEMAPGRDGFFVCAFVLKDRRVADAKGRRKKDAKQECAKNVLQQWKSDPVLSKYVNRITLGIKVGKRDAPPVGYEYPVQIYDRRHRKYHYQSNACDPQYVVRLEAMFDNQYRLEVYHDRGLFDGNDPSVEEMYIDRWADVFKGKKRNIPVHCHEYLRRDGHFIKPFTDERERRIWKAIWKAYPSPRKRQKQQLQPQEDIRKYQQKQTKCTHFVVYDFDGTVYCRRLYNDIMKTQTQNQSEYIQQLIMSRRVLDGFGGLERVQALKNHFAKVRQYPNVRTALTGYVKGQHMHKLFDAIGVDMNQYFDVILDPKHQIFIKAAQNGGFKKNGMIQMLSDQYQMVSRDDVLYIDDDTAIKQQVTCCQVFQAQKRGKGLTIQELNDIVHVIGRKWKQKPQHHSNANQYSYNAQANYQQNHHNYNSYSNRNQSNYHDRNQYNNHQNVKMEHCVDCEKSFDVKLLKCVDQMYLCHHCLSAQQNYNY